MFLTNIKQTEENLQFQRGNCEFLACALYEAFDYPAKVLVRINHDTAEPLSDQKLLSLSYDQYGDYAEKYDFEDVDSVELIHCFSYFQRGAKTYYVDSRGMTNDINDILKTWDISMKDVNEGEYKIVDFKNPEDIKQYFWSTYHDWKGDDDFEKQTEEHRVKPAKAFVEEYKNKLRWPVEKEKSERRNKEVER